MTDAVLEPHAPVGPRNAKAEGPVRRGSQESIGIRPELSRMLAEVRSDFVEESFVVFGLVVVRWVGREGREGNVVGRRENEADCLNATLLAELLHFALDLLDHRGPRLVVNFVSLGLPQRLDGSELLEVIERREGASVVLRLLRVEETPEVRSKSLRTRRLTTLSFLTSDTSRAIALFLRYADLHDLLHTFPIYSIENA